MTLSFLAVSLYTDAAASLGYGAVYSSYWFYGYFSLQCRNLNITLLELDPVVVAVNVSGYLWKNHCVRFFTHSQALVHILNRQASKDKHIMKLVRCLVLACLHHIVVFQSEHIMWPGRVAQSVGHLIRKSEVLGSIPGLATYFRFSFC